MQAIPYLGMERRSSLGKQVRQQMEGDIIKLRMIFSALHQSPEQQLPEASQQALKLAGAKLSSQLEREGLPAYRIAEIKKTAC